MSRSGYDSPDGDYDQWSSIRWAGQLASAMRGKRGQAFLLELVQALEAMPEKRLIADDLIRGGEVCAIGSVGKRRGVDMTGLDPCDYDTLSGVFGIAHQLVREIEYQNDEASSSKESPEARWQRMRDWAIGRLLPVEEPA